MQCHFLKTIRFWRWKAFYAQWIEMDGYKIIPISQEIETFCTCIKFATRNKEG